MRLLDLTPSPRVAVSEPIDEPRRVIAVADFESACEGSSRNMKDAWDETTARDARALVRIFKGVLEEHGVEHTGQITQYHLGELRQHFNDIPVNWGKKRQNEVDVRARAGLNYNSVVRPRILAILADYAEFSHTSDLRELVDRGETSAFLNWTHQEKVGRFDALVLFLDDAAIDNVGDLKERLQESGFRDSSPRRQRRWSKTVDYMGCLVGMDSVALDRQSVLSRSESVLWRMTTST